MKGSKWRGIGGSLMVGLFVAYLDRTNLSVAIPSVARDMGFAGDRFPIVSSWALTIFLIGYALANVFGGFATRSFDPKPVVVWCFTIWSAATVVVGFSTSLTVLLICRLILGVAEGVYWPQQSRFAKAWFAPGELTKANAVIQYYGQYFALAIGFIVLTPIYEAFGWRTLFFATGGIGLVLIVPLYIAKLRPESAAPYAEPPQRQSPRLTLDALGGPPFLLIIFSYITQGMLFWGITLWIPLAVRSIGFTGLGQAWASALPYFAAIAFTVPMAALSDRTGRRVLIASASLLIPGVLLLFLAQADSGYAKLALITVSMGLYASSFTPNIWSILQSTVEPRAIGSAAGIMNGLGAGGGGTLAGFLVGLLQGWTGSYMAGFGALGGLSIIGGLSLLAYGRLKQQESPAKAYVP
ncbi:MAG: MFS transporter [Acetobacteraceae bacterium]|nr:MFS transporter [Acetobacteraceae bacterium]